MLAVDDPEYAPGILLVPDMQDRHQDEVAPAAVTRRRGSSVVTIIFDVEPVLLDHFPGLFVLGDLPPIDGVLGLVVFSVPDLLVLPLLHEGGQIHLHGILVAHHGQQTADLRNGGGHLGLRRLPLHDGLRHPR